MNLIEGEVKDRPKKFTGIFQTKHNYSFSKEYWKYTIFQHRASVATKRLWYISGRLYKAQWRYPVIDEIQTIFFLYDPWGKTQPRLKSNITKSFQRCFDTMPDNDKLTTIWDFDLWSNKGWDSL